MSERVEPDGPIPCDLVVAGEAPSSHEFKEGRGFVGPSGRMLWKREDGDADLIGSIVGRERSTVYVTNVCKVALPEEEWKRLSLDDRGVFESELRRELTEVRPRLVLPFGVRAAKATAPDFTTITECHGKLMPGYGKYVVMPMWHPAAYLRGNRAVLGMLADDLSKVPDILAMDGLADLVKHHPKPEVAIPDWPERIGFLVRVAARKADSCQLPCKATQVMRYEGRGLRWKLCLTHAIRTAEWAKRDLAPLREHAKLAIKDKRVTKLERASKRMEVAFVGKA